MRRKIPVPADVRAALADVRRARASAAQPRPDVVTRVVWSSVTATCRFCGEEGPARRPASADVAVCLRTLAEITAIPPAPEGRHVDDVLATLERWMAPVEGEPAVSPWPVSDDRCAACARGAAEVSQLFLGEGAALCFECAEHAAADAVDPALRAEFLSGEADAARRELDDLDRIRREVKDTRAIRRNATAALSLLRLLSLPDDTVRTRLLEVVRALDA